MSYEHSNGLGWSELSFWEGGADCASVNRDGYTPLCFVDSDILDRTTAERAGCVPYSVSGVFDRTRRHQTCTTSGESRNAGHIYCCPPNAVQAMPMTPEARQRATDLLEAEARAEAEGRLPQPGSSVEPVKIMPQNAETPEGRTEPFSQEEINQSGILKVSRIIRPVWVFAALAVGAGGCLGYIYYSKNRRRHR